jgi:hypothetical protein
MDQGLLLEGDAMFHQDAIIFTHSFHYKIQIASFIVLVLEKNASIEKNSVSHAIGTMVQKARNHVSAGGS